MTVGTTIGEAVAAATPADDAVKIVLGFVTLLASPTGQALLNQFFVDHGISQDKLDAVIVGLQPLPPPKA